MYVWLRRFFWSWSTQNHNDHDVPHIIIYFVPHCTRMFCFSWFIFCFDCPSPKWRFHPVPKRTLASKRREEWRWEEISGTLKGLENLPTGEFFLEYLDCESARFWFWALDFLENWTEIHCQLSYKKVILYRWTNSENNTSLQKKSKYFFYGN